MEIQPKDSSSDPADIPNVKLKVLIVDDEVNLGQMLVDTLDEYGFETAFAETSEDALKLMPEFRPKVALVDYRLGDITGLEVAQLLKKIDEELPVIIMTAYASLDLAVKAIQSDIYDFIPKPVDKSHLMRSLGKAAEKRQLSEENKKLIAFLKQTNVELERLNNMKSKFLSIVTHDLRTPLTSIQGYSEMLQTMQNLSAENRTKCFSSISAAVERMKGLIHNLLDMVSIESGKLRVEKSSIDFLALCQEVKEMFAPVAVSKKVALEWDIPPGSITIMGDSNRLVQVLNNLISNALKHIPENGKIFVKVFPKDKMMLTEVSDNGEGISPDDQKKIFGQFYQVETSATRREGIGLGLSISKDIIGAHQGEIGVFSEGMGKGTKFWFTLPLLNQ